MADAGFMRLLPSFIAGLDWRSIKGARFLAWARTEREARANFRPHYWAPLRAGKPIPAEMARAFSDYVGDVLHLCKAQDARLSAIAETCEPEGEGKEEDGWQLGWFGHLKDASRGFQSPDEGFCENEADVALAARMVMQTVGEQSDRSLKGRPAIDLAERIMGKGFDEYVAFLRMLWDKTPDSILFATVRQGASVMRVGVSVIAPVSESFYGRMRAGRAEDMDATPSDLEEKSRFLIYEAIAENRELDVRRGRAKRGMAQVRTLAHQMALLCPRQFNPHILAFAGTDENQRREKIYGFFDLGVDTPTSGKAVFELAPPDRAPNGSRYPQSLAHYLAMRSLLQLYRAVVVGEQIALDD